MSNGAQPVLCRQFLKCQNLSVSRKLLSEAEKEELIDFVASDPFAGDVMSGTGGVRKLRWGRDALGKRGGSRVIYLFGGIVSLSFLSLCKQRVTRKT